MKTGGDIVILNISLLGPTGARDLAQVPSTLFAALKIYSIASNHQRTSNICFLCWKCYTLSAGRLNCNDSEGAPVFVQMVTALVFQLIQCVVQLPAERDSEEEHKKKVAAWLINLCDYHNRGTMLNVPNCISRWTKTSSSWTPTRLPWGQRRIFCLSSSRSKWASAVRSSLKPH